MNAMMRTRGVITGLFATVAVLGCLALSTTQASAVTPRTTASPGQTAAALPVVDMEAVAGLLQPGRDPTSAGTHDGGGVVDINIDGMSADIRPVVARALREVGFAAWIRDPTQGDWPWHIHAAAISDTDLSTQAQNQTGDYYLGFNGLADHGPDDGPRIPIHTWEDYQRPH